ncbi:MAG: ATP12 family protein [Rickettsiales bacterium]
MFKSVEKTKIENGFHILLDGKPMRTAAGNTVVVSKEPHADAIVFEWRGISGKINLLTMPHTRLAMALADFNDALKEEKIAHVLSYAMTDMLCFREPHDEALIKRQKASWDRWVAWIEKSFGAKFSITSGLMPHQNHPDLTKIESHLKTLSPMKLIALDHYVNVTGSLILGFAYLEKAISLPELVATAFLDEEYQAEKWGADEEAGERRRAITEELNVISSVLD